MELGGELLTKSFSSHVIARAAFSFPNSRRVMPLPRLYPTFYKRQLIHLNYRNRIPRLSSSFIGSIRHKGTFAFREWEYRYPRRTIVPHRRNISYIKKLSNWARLFVYFVRLPPPLPPVLQTSRLFVPQTTIASHPRTTTRRIPKKGK